MSRPNPEDSADESGATEADETSTTAAEDARAPDRAERAGTAAGDDVTAAETDPELLRAQIAVLEEQNRRLRREYARSRRVSYRRTARGLGVIGGVAVVGAALLPAVREVLLVLGAIGLFGAVLTYYLTPGRFVAAETGERIYATLDDTIAALATQLDLTEERVYVPVDGMPPVRLFIPVHERYEVPDQAALADPLVVDDTDSRRGLAIVPGGAYLFEEFERTLTGQFGADARTATTQLGDGLVEGFELAEAVETTVNAGDGRVTVGIEGSVYGGAERFENPLASFVAVGLAHALETPVRTTVQSDETPGSLTVTCHWEVK